MSGDRELTSDDVVGYDGPDGPARFAADLAAWEEREMGKVAGGGWYASTSADPTHDDQELDLGGGWWAGVIDPGPLAGAIAGEPWRWALHDKWLADEQTGDYSTVASGTAATQAAAKAAALDAYRTGHQ